MQLEPSTAELERLRRFGHSAFGYYLTLQQAVKAWRISNGGSIWGLGEPYPMNTAIREIGRCWKCCRNGGSHG